MLKKIISLGLLMIMSLSCMSCAKSYSPKIVGENLISNGYVKWMGRHYYDDEQDAVAFHMSASGFEVQFKGTQLVATISGTWLDGASGVGETNPFFNVFVDDENDPTTAKKIKIDNTEPKKYVLAEGLKDGTHEICVYKSSESVYNQIFVHSIATDGVILDAPANREPVIEFFGDSITCGYGMTETDMAAQFSTATEEALQSYAYLTARMFDADFRYFSVSGWGLNRGLSENSSIAKWFDYIDVNTSIEWDVRANPADIVVINLGANDNQYIIGNVGGAVDAAEKKRRLDNYIDTYKQFISTILETYGEDTEIFCCYGMLGETTLYEPIRSMVDTYINEGYKNIHAVQLVTQGSQPALHGHPNLYTQAASADVLAENIQKFTLYKQVRENIKVN